MGSKYLLPTINEIYNMKELNPDHIALEFKINWYKNSYHVRHLCDVVEVRSLLMTLREIFMRKEFNNCLYFPKLALCSSDVVTKDNLIVNIVETREDIADSINKMGKIDGSYNHDTIGIIKYLQGLRWSEDTRTLSSLPDDMETLREYFQT